MLRTITALLLALQLSACVGPGLLLSDSRHRAPWDPDPREGGSLLNQRRPSCAGTC